MAIRLRPFLAARVPGDARPDGPPISPPASLLTVQQGLQGFAAVIHVVQPAH